MIRSTLIIIIAVAMVISKELEDIENTTQKWFDNGRVTIFNVTDTSVVVGWPKPKELPPEDLQNYRLIITYWSKGASPTSIEAKDFDKRCSILLSYCRLQNLHPGEAYSVEVVIDHLKTGVVQGRAIVPFATLKTPKDLSYWLVFVGIPVLAILLLVVVFICFARWCGCCCWHKKRSKKKNSKKAKLTAEETELEQRRSKTKQSQAKKQWVQDTLNCVDIDPPSTYDHPIEPGRSMSASSRSHFYMEMEENITVTTPTSATSGFEPRKLSKSVSQTSKEKSSMLPKPLNKSHTNPRFFSSNQYEEPIDHEPKSPNKSSQRPPQSPFKFGFKLEDLNKSSSLPNNKNVLKPINHSSSGSDIAQQLENRFQKRQHSTNEEAQYANTVDLNQLKGNARKMFPVL